MTEGKLKQKDVLRAIRALGLSANVFNGEYRVDYLPHDPRFKRADRGYAKATREEGSKYFTTDPQDALGTARYMATADRLTKVQS